MSVRGVTPVIVAAAFLGVAVPKPAGAQSTSPAQPVHSATAPQRAAPPPPQRAARLPPGASRTSAGPAPTAPVGLQPFGPGTPVEVTTPDSQQVTVYVARAVELKYRPPDWEFVKLGKTPLTFELPPEENYWLEVESPEVTRGSLLLRVDRQPKHLLVRPGSSNLGSLGSLTLAVGGLAVAVATVILISGTGGESGIDKPKILIPMYVAGGALLAGGIGLYFASRTDVEDPSRPEAAAWPHQAPGTGRLPTLVAGIGFQF